MYETRGGTPTNIWLSYLLSCTKGEEVQAGISRKEGKFVGYCENSKVYKIYLPGHRNIEFNRDATFDEDPALGKARDTSPILSIIERRDDIMNEDTELSMLEPDLADEPKVPMDHLDPPPCDPRTRKGPLWLRDTLQDAERHLASRGTF